MNKALLKFIALFNPLLRRFGIHTGQMHAILLAKLTVDDRSSTNMMGQKRTYNPILKILLMLGFGFFMIFFLIIAEQPLLAHTIFFIVFMVMMISTLIADFTNVIIDVRDNYTILPRPVNDSTFTVARILHIFLHLVKLVLPLVLPAMIYLLVKEDILVFLAFIIEILSAVLISVFLVNALYLAILRFMKPERFRDVIAYFQIGFIIIIFIGYYVMPRLADQKMLDHIDLLNHWLSYWLPPVWMAGLHELAKGSFTLWNGIFALLTILVPIFSLFLIVKYMAPGFNMKIAQMGSASSDIMDPSDPDQRNKLILADWLAKNLTFSRLEHAGFQITWRLSARIREFKVSSYPSFAFIPLYFFYLIFVNNKDQSLAERWQHLPLGKSYLLLLYLLVFISFTVLQQITRANKYQASWVFYTIPNSKPGRLLAGMFKAVMFKFFLPLALLISVFVFWVWGWRIFPDVILAISNDIFISLIIASALTRKFPFSEPVKIDRQMGRIFDIMLVALLPLGIGFVHQFISQWPLVVYIFIFISLLSNWLLFREYASLEWKQIKN